VVLENIYKLTNTEGKQLNRHIVLVHLVAAHVSHEMASMATGSLNPDLGLWLVLLLPCKTLTYCENDQ
jgi:hypothetical protein